MVRWVEYLNILIFILFFCCYGYQLVYVIARFVRKMPQHTAKEFHRFAVVIAARNESQVIGELLDSVRAQNYPMEQLDVYVVADNCDDETAQTAYQHGAVVFERHNRQKVGKGYALNYAFDQINRLTGLDYYDGYMVFDADNVLDENYVREMNNVFDAGYRVVTSYRNSKNYGYNWISAGYALWFLRESKYLNGARMLLHTSCAISGTGFLVSKDIIKKDKGWKYNLLTEDIEFTVDKVIGDEVIGYSEKSVLYDEQPVDFETSWNQRLRWSKGFYQVMHNYGTKLVRGCLPGKKFQCFDMLMTTAPAMLLTISMLIINFLFGFYGLMSGHVVTATTAFLEIWVCAVNIYLSLFFFGLVTIITEWKHIHCSNGKKIWYLFTFPLFMFTYLPISIAAIHKKITWEPIRHTFAVSATEIRR